MTIIILIMIFIILSGFTAAWSVAWFLLVHNQPEAHPRISPAELSLLSGLADGRKTVRPVPWRAILTSPPVWGTLITDCCNTWGIVTLASFGPKFIKSTLGVDIKTMGFLSGLPMMAR